MILYALCKCNYKFENFDDFLIAVNPKRRQAILGPDLNTS